MHETDIQAFWETHPCGDLQVGQLEGGFRGDYARFFDDYDRFRYRREAHILDALNRFEWCGKNVLEIGIGQGADSEQLIRRGALWSGLDITQEAISRMRARALAHKLPIVDLKQGSALDIPYESDSFDAVFSHGVLHHIPDIQRAQSEIRRVLKPGGSLIMMVYARHSMNYQLSIRYVRRAILLMTHLLNIPLPGIHDRLRTYVREEGPKRALKLENFLHKSTDGPDNPFSRVYSLKEIRRDFQDFDVAEHFKCWMHAPPLPVHWLPAGSLMGWHLWARLTPRPELKAHHEGPHRSDLEMHP